MLSSDIRTGALILSFQVSGRKIEKIFASRGSAPALAIGEMTPKTLKVAAVGLESRPYKNLKAYLTHMEYLVRQAVEEEAGIVVFPQYTGLLPLTLLPGFGRILAQLEDLERDEKNLRDAFRLVIGTLGDFLWETYMATFGCLARRYGVYLMAGSIYECSGEKIFHRAYLFDPAGAIAGVQSKLLLSPFERTFGVEREEKLEVFPTLFGKVGILFEEDLAQFELSKILREQGANLILSPGGVLGGEELPCRELLPVFRTQERGLYIARAGMVNRIGLPVTGKAGIYGPFSLTSGKDGVLAQGASHTQGGTVVAHTDLTCLSKWEDLYTADHSPAFTRGRLLGLYDRQVDLPVLERQVSSQPAPEENEL